MIEKIFIILALKLQQTAKLLIKEIESLKLELNNKNHKNIDKKTISAIKISNKVHKLAI